MMDDFETAEIQTGETSILARWVRVRAVGWNRPQGRIRPTALLALATTA
jgi:hypothetical protein